MGLGADATSPKMSFIKVPNLPAGKIKMITCGYGHLLILYESGTLFGCGYNSNRELGLKDKQNRTQV